jgi:hypothetical protein
LGLNKQGAERIHRAILDVEHDVGLRGERDVGLGVPEPLAHDLHKLRERRSAPRRSGYRVGASDLDAFLEAQTTKGTAAAR